jgi:hypothetical protein
MSDFNSSEIEVEAPQPRFPNLAKKSVRKIIAESSQA